MNSFDERFLVYMALVVVSATAGALIDWQAGLWTLVQMACVVELVYWLGRPAGDTSGFDSDYRA